MWDKIWLWLCKHPDFRDIGVPIILSVATSLLVMLVALLLKILL